MKLFTLVTLATTATLFTTAVFAQQSTTSLGAAPISEAPAGVSSTVVIKPKTAPSNVVLGFKSSNDSGRVSVMDVKGSRTAKSKNEAYLGYRFDNGWGGFYNAVNTYSSYYHQNEQLTKNKKAKPDSWGVGDPSITLLHPDFYKDSNLIMFGQFRYYIPTTDNSVDKKINLFSYYFRLNAKFEGGHEIYNEIIPRYFGSTKYGAADTTNYVEDTTIYSYKIDGTGWKVGAKSWAQVEEHKITGTGYCLEAGPQASYSFSSSFTISPSISFPLLQSNVVYEGPKAVGTDQAYVSLLLQARL